MKLKKIQNTKPNNILGTHSIQSTKKSQRMIQPQFSWVTSSEWEGEKEKWEIKERDISDIKEIKKNF